jgi:hypothetical protein
MRPNCRPTTSDLLGMLTYDITNQLPVIYLRNAISVVVKPEQLHRVNFWFWVVFGRSIELAHRSVLAPQLPLHAPSFSVRSYLCAPLSQNTQSHTFVAIMSIVRRHILKNWHAGPFCLMPKKIVFVIQCHKNIGQKGANPSVCLSAST